MNLNPIKANMTELDLGKIHILFSYKTPVAFRYSGDDMTYITDKFWSRTTSRHINQWTAGIPEYRIKTISQDELYKLAEVQS